MLPPSVLVATLTSVLDISAFSVSEPLNVSAHEYESDSLLRMEMSGTPAAVYGLWTCCECHSARDTLPTLRLDFTEEGNHVIQYLSIVRLRALLFDGRSSLAGRKVPRVGRQAATTPMDISAADQMPSNATES